MADGVGVRAATFGDGRFDGGALHFTFAEEALVYAPVAPKKVLAVEKELPYTYQPETKLLKITGPGQPVEARVQF